MGVRGWPGPAPSIRLRLTLWYGGLFLLAGALLLAANFALVARNFPPAGRDAQLEAVAERLGVPVEALSRARQIPVERPRPGGRRDFFLEDLFGGINQEIRKDTLERLLVQSALGLGVMAVVSVGLGWFVAGRLLRPVHEITATARRISEQHLGERIALGGPSDELRGLADQFDAMLDRLQSAFDVQREFVANASHELRTPLTIIRTELDVTLEDGRATPEQLTAMRDVVRRAVDRTEGLIERLLLLARAEVPLERFEAVRLDVAVRRAVDALAPQLAEQGIALDVSALAPAVVRGDPVLLDRLVGNLVENAVQHNEPGGWITIATVASEGSAGGGGESSGGMATLRVANGGGVIGEQELPRLFERFTRRERSRSRQTGGYGLGLSIVRAIADAHHGSADATALPGGGLAVEVALPSEAPAA